MASYILRNGNFVRIKGYDRGPMLIYSEEEWRDRSDSFFLNPLKRVKQVVLILLAIHLLLIALVYILDVDMGDEGLFLPSISLAVIILLGIATYVWNVSRELSTNPSIGLYERGLQHTWRSFIPYTEIIGLEVGSNRRKSGYCVVINTKDWPITGKRAMGQLAMSFDFLGEEGVRELESRVHAPGSPK